jgi:allantoicase
MISTMFTDLPDLAAERLGGAVIAANDEFFAPKEGLIKAGPPEWREGVYTERGKWMDGWETRRRRTPGHDWAVIRLGVPGIVRGVVIDTSFYTGNFPEFASLDGQSDGGDGKDFSKERWVPLLKKTPLKGNTTNLFEIPRPSVRPSVRTALIRLNIYPDGGVARLRVHGEAVPDESVFRPGREVDLAALEHGGVVIGASDMHYGRPQNVLLPGRSTHMGDGWETKRRRGPGHDWLIVKLARRGVIERVELDTDHYKGNAPGRCMLEYADAAASLDPAKARWHTLLSAKPLEPHTRHRWNTARAKAATHVRLNIYPDGGVARLRLFGRVEA